MNRNRLGGVAFLAISLGYGYFAAEIPSLPIDREETMSARSLPFLLAAMGVLLSVVTIVLPATDAEAPDAGADTARHWPGVIALSAAVLGYALVIDWLGFLLATFLFLSGGFVLLGERRWPVVVVTAGALVAGLWLVLAGVLDIYLAPGRLLAGAG